MIDINAFGDVDFKNKKEGLPRGKKPFRVKPRVGSAAVCFYQEPRRMTRGRMIVDSVERSPDTKELREWMYAVSLQIAQLNKERIGASAIVVPQNSGWITKRIAEITAREFVIPEVIHISEDGAGIPGDTHVLLFVLNINTKNIRAIRDLVETINPENVTTLSVFNTK